MIHEIPWAMGIAFAAWLALGRAFGLRQGVRVGFVLYGAVAAVLSALHPLFLLMLLAVTPFAAITALAGVWLGDKLRRGDA